MKVKIEGVEIRGIEEKQSKKEGGGSYLVVRFEDSTGKPCEIIDKDLERAQFYKRGAMGDIYADLAMGRSQGQQWAKLTVVDFKLAAGV